jgi:hypothetical protein
MSTKRKPKGLWSNKHLRYIIGIMVLCTLVYYLPAITGRIGWTSFSNSMQDLHNLFGIDFLGLIFFSPVVYAS